VQKGLKRTRPDHFFWMLAVSLEKRGSRRKVQGRPDAARDNLAKRLPVTGEVPRYAASTHCSSQERLCNRAAAPGISNH